MKRVVLIATMLIVPLLSFVLSTCKGGMDNGVVDLVTSVM